jgi:hypothetical protein
MRFSDLFRKGSGGPEPVSIYSFVRIRPTATDVSRDLIPHPARDKLCLARIIRTVLDAEGNPVVSVLVKPLPFAAPSWTHPLAYQAVVSVVPPSVKSAVTVYADAVAFAYGQDQLELIAFGVVQPVPPEAEQRLVGLMLSRAKAHRH